MHDIVLYCRIIIYGSEGLSTLQNIGRVKIYWFCDFIKKKKIIDKKFMELCFVGINPLEVIILKTIIDINFVIFYNPKK